MNKDYLRVKSEFELSERVFTGLQIVCETVVCGVSVSHL